MMAHSLAVDYDLDLADDYADLNNLIAAGNLRSEQHALAGRDGRLRPVHDVGMPLAFVPWFAVAYTVAERVTPMVPPPASRTGWVTTGFAR
jgi:hypothetical protein